MLASRSLLALLLSALPCAAQCSFATFGAPDGTTVGASLQYDGEQLLAPQWYQGRILVFERSGSDWIVRQEIEPSVPGTDAGLGFGLSLDGDRLAVGAPYESTQAQYAGAVYLFERSGQGTWVEAAHILPPVPTEDLYFGWSISLSGDTLAVSKGGLYNGDEGVYVYRRVGTTWQVEDVVLGSDWESGDLFGGNLALDGETLVVGSRGHDGSAWNGGAAYVFERSDTQGWMERAKLFGSLTSNFDAFGLSVDVEGDRIAVGCNREDLLGPDVGAAYIYERTPSGWMETARLDPPEVQNWQRFGRRVELCGDRISVLQEGARAPVIFDLRGGEWVYRAEFNPLPGLTNSPSTAMWADEVMVGSTEQGFPSTGVVREFELSRTVQPYCSCADRAWCPDMLGGCDSSQGFGARIEACGSTSVQLDDLVLTAHRLPPQQFGLFFMGGDQGRLAFGDGERCVAPGAVGLYRFPIRTSGATGEFSEGPGLALQSSTLFGTAGAITAGSTWYFQAWYRDPVGPICDELVQQTTPRGFNLSNALQITFEP